MEYISSTSQGKLSVAYQRVRLICVALAVSVTVFVALAWVIPAKPAGAALSWANNFYFAAIAIGLGVVAVRRVLLSSFRLKMVKQAGVDAVVNNYGLASVICAAVGEAVGILGFVAYLLTADRQFAWRLGAVGLMIIAFSFPRRYEWQRGVHEAEQQQAGQGAR